MYDWPEARAEVNAEWEGLRNRLRTIGIDAPRELVRRNADMPAVPGGIRDAAGRPVAADPAMLPPDRLDLAVLWRHPGLLFGQTCWGPMEHGLRRLVRVVGQPDYSRYEGGRGTLYSSAVVARRGDFPLRPPSQPQETSASLPADRFAGRRLAFNDEESMSGLIALTRDLEAEGRSLSIFAERIRTGAHRESIRAVADGRADLAAIDCRTWHLALLHEPAAGNLAVVGWTRLRPGLPYIASPASPVRSIP